MKALTSILVLSATLTACGGGGSASVNGNQSQPIALTAQNYDAAASEVMASSATLLGGTNLASDVLVGADVKTTPSVINYIQKKLPDWINNINGQQAQLVAAAVTSTQACSSGGTVSVTVDDSNGSSTLDPGDKITIVANKCAADGETTNGQMTMTFTRVSQNSGFSGANDSAMNVQTNQFGTTVNGVTTVSNGSFDMEIKSQYVSGSNGYLQNVELKISISSLDNTITSGSTTKIYEYRDYVLQSTSYNNQTTQTIKGSINIPTLGSNTATIETIRSFVSTVSSNGSSYVAYPTEGVALVTFKQGGKVRTTANGTSNALVELDLTGDGQYETSKQVPWNTIL